MSQDLNLLECVDLIEETKENSKNALTEKGVELDESYVLSQVDEKIAEIVSGGGGFTQNKIVSVYDTTYKYYINYGQMLLGSSPKFEVTTSEIQQKAIAVGFNMYGESFLVDGNISGNTITFEPGYGRGLNHGVVLILTMTMDNVMPEVSLFYYIMNEM